MGLSVRKASSLLELHGRGYGIESVWLMYRQFAPKAIIAPIMPLRVDKIIESLKPNTPKIRRNRRVGPYDNNLQLYMKIFLKRKLHPRFNADDILQECNLAIWTQPNLKKQLASFLKTNIVPKGRDLSLLKAVLYRQRLKFIEKETRYPIERLMCNHPTEDEYDDGS